MFVPACTKLFNNLKSRVRLPGLFGLTLEILMKLWTTLKTVSKGQPLHFWRSTRIR